MKPQTIGHLTDQTLHTFFSAVSTRNHLGTFNLPSAIVFGGIQYTVVEVYESIDKLDRTTEFELFSALGEQKLTFALQFNHVYSRSIPKKEPFTPYDLIVEVPFDAPEKHAITCGRPEGTYNQDQLEALGLIFEKLLTTVKLHEE